MPSALPLDPTLVNAVADALSRAGTAALETSDELLASYGDTGDSPTQRAVDTLIEGAADALRALSDSMADSARKLERHV